MSKAQTQKKRRPVPAAPRPAVERRQAWVLRHRWGVVSALACCACAAVVWALARQQVPAAYGFQVVRTFPHDAGAYTQGLVYHEGTLYEGTGKYGQSTLRQVDLETGKILQLHSLEDRLFGEGIAIWDEKILQLTWKSRFGVVYDRKTFRETARFRYSGQGWGLTHDGAQLIMSDGTSTLRFLDPQTYQVVRQLHVRDRGRRVDNLNELEYVHGEVLANIWGDDYIARISPRTGEVTGWIDLRRLWPGRRDPEAVLNGIAYDAKEDRLFVTGKNWPKLYQIRVVAR